MLKIAPVTRRVGAGGFEQINVQVYGGGLWGTWLDRDLTLSGRVIVLDPETKKLTPKIWHSEKALMRIASLAPHLKTNKSDYSINTEFHIRPILCTSVVDSLFAKD